MEKKLADHRENYEKHELLESQCPENPFDLVEQWISEATKALENDVNAMFLSTAGNDDQPSSRAVLLKEIYEEKFVFYTNYESRKGIQISENPKVSLLFWWKELERQIRIDGIAEKVSRETSEAYFHIRPVGSQIGAVASPQSQIVTKDQLIQSFEEADNKYKGLTQIPLPAQWGGYTVTPHLIESWQGRPNRMHDRIEYILEENVWVKNRLAP